MSTKHIDPSVQSVGEVIDHVQDLAAGQDTVEVDALVGSFEGRMLPSMMLIPGLLLVSPLSGVPGFSSVCGLMIAFVALNLLIGRDRIWMPDRLRHRLLRSDRLSWGLQKVRSVATSLDQRIRKRLLVLIDGPILRLLYGLCALVGLVMPLMEVIPFSSSFLGGSVALIAVGIVFRDGLIALLGVSVITIMAGMGLKLVNIVA